MPETVIPQLEALFGVPLQEGYGLSEATSIVTSNPNEKTLHRAGTVGLALPGLKLSIRDPETMDVLGTHQTGEVWVKGPTVCQGYWRNPEATHSRILPDGWLRTGDLGCLDESGYLTLINRQDDVINVAGLKVYPREIEEVIVQHPAVQQVAVLGVPCPRRFQTIVACVVLSQGNDLTLTELKRFCKQSLSGYKVPKILKIMEILPQTASGKIKRHLLASTCQIKG
jgi:acyl-CoA synthetase (AMP-forming)/AMP-acid ligase II